VSGGEKYKVERWTYHADNGPREGGLHDDKADVKGGCCGAGQRAVGVGRTSGLPFSTSETYVGPSVRRAA